MVLRLTGGVPLPACLPACQKLLPAPASAARMAGEGEGRPRPGRSSASADVTRRAPDRAQSIATARVLAALLTSQEVWATLPSVLYLKNGGSGDNHSV